MNGHSQAEAPSARMRGSHRFNACSLGFCFLTTNQLRQISRLLSDRTAIENAYRGRNGQPLTTPPPPRQGWFLRWRLSCSFISRPVASVRRRLGKGAPHATQLTTRTLQRRAHRVLIARFLRWWARRCAPLPTLQSDLSRRTGLLASGL